MPRGTASRGTTRYRVRLDVPRRGGWRAWGTARASFECALADPVDPAIAAAEIASEHRRGAGYIRVTIAVAVAAADVAEALAIAWDAFGDAAADDPDGWEVTAAAAEVRPALLPGDGVPGHAAGSAVAGHDRAEPQRAGHQVVVHVHLPRQGQDVRAFLVGDGDRVLGERAGDLFQSQLVFIYLDEMLTNRKAAGSQPGIA